LVAEAKRLMFVGKYLGTLPVISSASLTSLSADTKYSRTPLYSPFLNAKKTFLPEPTGGTVVVLSYSVETFAVAVCGLIVCLPATMN